MSSSANEHAKKLIRSVVRAFYPDEMIVVVDFLLRAKFCKEDEIGPILRMGKKTFQTAISTLKEEMIVQTETIPTSRKPLVYCYINYRLVVNVIRYRFHLLEKNRESVEERHSSSQFQCTSYCKKIFTDLEAMKFRDAKGKMYCPDCCPSSHALMLTQIVDPKFHLVLLDGEEGLSKAQQLTRKIEDQLCQGSRDREEAQSSISDMIQALSRLPEAPSTNIPSINLGRGDQGFNKIGDEAAGDIKKKASNQERRDKKAEDEQKEAVRGKIDAIGSGTNKTFQEREDEKKLLDQKQAIGFGVGGGGGVVGGFGGGAPGNLSNNEVNPTLPFQPPSHPKEAKQTQVPEFLKGSGILGLRVNPPITTPDQAPPVSNEDEDDVDWTAD